MDHLFCSVLCLKDSVMSLQVQDLCHSREKNDFGGKTLLLKIIKTLVTAHLEGQVTVKFPNLNQ